MSELDQKIDLEMPQNNFSGQRKKYFFFDLLPAPIGLPCVLGRPRWFCEYFCVKIFNTEARIPQSDRENDTDRDLGNFSKKGTPEGIRVCTWLCMGHQILNFPQIFIETHQDPPQRRPKGVL